MAQAISAAPELGSFSLTLTAPRAGSEEEPKTETFTFGCILDPHYFDVGRLGAAEAVAADADVARPGSSASSASSEYSHASAVSMALWAHVWVSNVFLCELLLHMHTALKGVSVHEVGAGCALPAVVAAACGGVSVASDVVSDAATAAHYSCTQGSIHPPVSYQVLDWADGPALAAAEQVDLVLGSDVCYAASHVPHLADAVIGLMSPGACAIIVDPGRPAADKLLQLLERRCGAGLAMQVYEVSNAWAQQAVARRLRLIIVTRQALDEEETPLQRAACAAAAAYQASRSAASIEDALELAGLDAVSPALEVSVEAAGSAPC